MQSENLTLRRAVRAALLAGAAASAAMYAPTALAQDDDEIAEIEEILVTGSRIVRQDYVAASPISTVDRELFDQTAAPTVEAVLNTLPQFVPAITSTSNNPSNGGQANVALRGLDTTRTLVLLDGRRIVPSNATGVVDLNLIPASIIQNVEIITGGASAVYGSDAVAGVVNIKTRDFTGLEVTGTWGRTGESDGRETQLGVTGGFEFAGGRGYAFGSLNYADRGGIIQGDRDFSDVALGYDGDTGEFVPLGSATIRQGRWDQLTANLPSQAAVDAYFSALDPNYVPGSATNGSAFGFNPDGSLFDVSPVINFTGDTNEPGQPVNPDSYTYNYAPPNYLQLPLERTTFFGRAGLEINESTEGYAQILWASYDVDTALAPTPATQLYVNVDNPQIAGNAALQTLLASRPDPLQPIRIRKRMIESGPRISANSYDVIQTLVGARGEIWNDWIWDAYGSWGNVDYTEKQLGNVSRSAFESLSLADDNGAAACGGITPFGIGSISPECAAVFTRSATNYTQVQQIVGEASVTGPVLDLPAGEAQIAAGVLYKYDDFQSIPDATLTQQSEDPVTGSTRVDIVGFNADDVTRGKTISKEIYLEANFPLIADAPFAQLLDLTVGYRLADHSVVGNISSYKAESVWTINDSVGFRGGYQRAVRAPNISELFSPATINFPSVTLGDPCSNDFVDPDGDVLGAPTSQAAADLCVAQGIPANVLPSYNFANSQVQGLAGGNPELQEETADTYTLGIVLASPFQDGLLSNLRGSIDYYQIEIEDAINAIAADTFIQRCFNPEFNPNLDNNNFFCTLFERDTGTGEIIDALEADINVSELKVKGIDFQVDYGTDLGPGALDLKLVATRLDSWKQAAIRGEAPEEFAGQAGFDFDALPEWKTTFNVGYSVAGFRGDLRWRYVGEMTDTDFPDFKLPSVDYYDVTLSYSFDNFDMLQGLTLRAGVNNLTDEEPVIYPSYQQSNTDPSTYDILGRRYFVSANYSFR